MAETIYNKGAAIRNTVVYALALAGCLVGLIMWHSWFGRGLMAVAVVWAVGGLKANWQAIHHGFVDLDNTPVEVGSTTMQRESPYAGMTVNERLFEAGLMPQWDATARSRNKEQMIELLGKVDLEDQAEWIADTILSNPAKYGF